VSCLADHPRRRQLWAKYKSNKLWPPFTDIVVIIIKINLINAGVNFSFRNCQLKRCCLFVLNVQTATDDVFDLGELLSTMSRQQLEDFWCSLSHKCASALMHLDDVEDDVVSVSLCLLLHVCFEQ